MSPRILRALILIAFLPLAVLRAEEGMWTFDNPPLKQMKEKYGFAPSQQWLDHLRLASVRFNDGGSGSFVSPHGLVLTNHHVAMGQLQKLSTAQKNYVKDGFYAKTQAEEIKATDLELNVLMSMEDVTARVMAVVKPGMDDAGAWQARKAEMARIEKESLDQTGLRSDVVTLYQGGEYWLYRYKKYTDVRIVFAPEQQAAFFGGDPDNFTYPRHDLDMALFRVYEDGKPIRSDTWLKWNAKGAGDGELVFVSGNPAGTGREYTVDQLLLLRDHSLPLTLKSLKRRLAVLRAYSSRGPEQARQATGDIFRIENSVKALGGEYQGLQQKAVMDKKQKEEEEFLRLVHAHAELNSKYGGAWKEVAQADARYLSMLKPSRFRTFRGGRLATLALTIVQYVREVKKPDSERLDGYHDSELDSLRFRLFSRAPVYPEMEQALLADGLLESQEELGSQDPFIKAVLDGRMPAQVVPGWVARTKLADSGFRKQLIEGGEQAVANSADPLIVVARKADPVVRETHKWVEDNVESVLSSAGEKIGGARFAAYGKSLYPDGTFTLRLAYGTVAGYPMNGTVAPSKTTLYGLYDRAAGFDFQPPFNLPERIRERRGKVDLSTPLNFVSTLDTTGGNSGSPIVNRNLELVGLLFDGNIESLVGSFVYNLEDNRSVGVHAAGMMEALRKLYDAGPLADELEGGKAAAAGAQR